MRSLLIAVLFLELSVNEAAAKEDGVSFGPAPAWAVIADPLPVPESVRGPVFVRRQAVQIHLDKNGQWEFNAVMMRLLDASALPLGNIALSWNPAAGTPTVHALKVYRNGVARDVLATTKFEILRREGQLETAVLDGTLTATLRVPDLRVGDDIELEYTLQTQDPTLRTDNSGILLLAQIPPPGRFNLRLSWERSQEPTIRPTPDIEPLVKREAQAISLSLDNPGSSSPPKDAPPRYSWQRLIEYSDFSSWQAVSARVAPLFAEAAAIGPKSAIKQEAADIAAATSDPLARAQAALKLVQQQVRYVYVGLNGGNLTPASADETWQRRYGDCKGKTVLLLALLRELEFRPSRSWPTMPAWTMGSTCACPFQAFSITCLFAPKSAASPTGSTAPCPTFIAPAKRLPYPTAGSCR